MPEVTISRTHLAELKHYEQLTGVNLQSVMAEALTDWIEVVMPSRLEAVQLNVATLATVLPFVSN